MKIINFTLKRLRHAAARLLGITGNAPPKLDGNAIDEITKNPDMLDIAADYETVWSMAEGLESDSDIAAELAECDQLLANKKPRPVTRAHRAAMATAVGCLALAGAVFFGYTLLPTSYSTALGEQRLVVLPDGSRMTLNTDSEVEVSYGDERHITLNKGEAYFDVARDPSHPFVVNTLSGQATALGTEFSVRLNHKATTVTVVEGLVAVSTKQRQSSPTPLSAGESLTLLDNGTSTRKQQVDTTPINYWREGKIYFQNQRLDASVAEFNRYLKRKLVIGDREINALRIAGIFRINDLDSFLFALNEAFDIKAVEVANTIMLVKNIPEPEPAKRS